MASQPTPAPTPASGPASASASGRASDSAAARAPVVRLAGVEKTFLRGDQPATTALQDITLDIARGEFVSLIGPSGCGKSTLLRVIGDLVAPTRGDVVVNGKPAPQARRDRR